MTQREREAGFTLIELLIVVTIITILASISIPKFADLLRKAQEGSLKGNLGTLRSSLQIYYADNLGTSIACDGPANTEFANALAPKYVSEVPKVKSGLHPPTADVYCDAELLGGSVHDGQGWYYDGLTPADSKFGSIWVACDHDDSKGSSWTDY